ARVSPWLPVQAAQSDVSSPFLGSDPAVSAGGHWMRAFGALRTDRRRHGNSTACLPLLTEPLEAGSIGLSGTWRPAICELCGASVAGLAAGSLQLGCGR